MGKYDYSGKCVLKPHASYNAPNILTRIHWKLLNCILGIFKEMQGRLTWRTAASDC